MVAMRAHLLGVLLVLWRPMCSDCTSSPTHTSSYPMISRTSARSAVLLRLSGGEREPTPSGTKRTSGGASGGTGTRKPKPKGKRKASTTRRASERSSVFGAVQGVWERTPSLSDALSTVSELGASAASAVTSLPEEARKEYRRVQGNCALSKRIDAAARQRTLREALESDLEIESEDEEEEGSNEEEAGGEEDGEEVDDVDGYVVDAEEDYGRVQLARAAATRKSAAAREGDGGPLSLSEQGALIGSVMLSPMGIAGLVAGVAVGSAVGFVAEKVEEVGSTVSAKYAGRVAQEKQHRLRSDEMASRIQEAQKISIKPRVEAAEATALVALLRAFLGREDNCRCADCACPICSESEAWASLNLGVVLCVRCAAVHRSLGTSVSRIKSLVYDEWDDEMVRTLVANGNAPMRKRYLAALPAATKEPTANCEDKKRKAFIRNKYVKLKWATPELKAARQVAEPASNVSGPSKGAAKGSARRGSNVGARPMASLSSDRCGS